MQTQMEQQAAEISKPASMPTPFVLIGANADSVPTAWLVDPLSHVLAPVSPDQRHVPHTPYSEPQTVEPRLIKLLCMLAAEAGQVVDRQQLIDALWPRVIVNDNSLNRAVSDLRKALQGHNHSWIQTIPKRGYRLNATVRLLSPAPGPTRRSPQASRQAANAWWRWTPTAAAAVLLGISVLVQWIPDSEVPTAPHIAAVTDDRLTSLEPLLQASSLAANRDDIARFRLLLEDNQFVVADTPPPAIVVTAHQLMAYVDRHEGISQLKLRHAFADDTPWVAFTTDEQIQHLQWSPLDDGLLFTVGKESREVGVSSYMRFMLLDMETLSLHELYRREITPKLEGNSGKLT